MPLCLALAVLRLLSPLGHGEPSLNAGSVTASRGSITDNRCLTKAPMVKLGAHLTAGTSAELCQRLEVSKERVGMSVHPMTEAFVDLTRTASFRYWAMVGGKFHWVELGGKETRGIASVYNIHMPFAAFLRHGEPSPLAPWRFAPMTMVMLDTSRLLQVDVAASIRYWIVKLMASASTKRVDANHLGLAKAADKKVMVVLGSSRDVQRELMVALGLDVDLAHLQLGLGVRDSSRRERTRMGELDMSEQGKRSFNWNLIKANLFRPLAARDIDDAFDGWDGFRNVCTTTRGLRVREYLASAEGSLGSFHDGVAAASLDMEETKETTDCSDGRRELKWRIRSGEMRSVSFMRSSMDGRGMRPKFRVVLPGLDAGTVARFEEAFGRARYVPEDSGPGRRRGYPAPRHYDVQLTFDRSDVEDLSRWPKHCVAKEEACLRRMCEAVGLPSGFFKDPGGFRGPAIESNPEYVRWRAFERTLKVVVAMAGSRTDGWGAFAPGAPLLVFLRGDPHIMSMGFLTFQKLRGGPLPGEMMAMPRRAR